MSEIILKYDNKSSTKTLVEFSNGTPKPDSEFQCSLYADKRLQNPKFKNNKVLVVQGSHLKYVGDNYEDRHANPTASRYVLMEVDEKKQVGKIFETEYFKLRPIIGSEDIDIDEEREKTEKQLEQDERSFIERQDDLTEVFGSHRRKRAMVTRLRNKVKDSTDAVQTAVEAIMENADTSLLLDEEGALDTMIIPCCKTAETVEDVYPLTNIFPDHVSRCLIEEAQKFIHPTGAEITEWKNQGEGLGSRFIVEHAKNPALAIVQNSQIHTEYACCLQLMVCLIRLYKVKSSEYRAKTVFTDLAEPVRDWVLSEFFLDGCNRNRKMPTRMKDKVLAYAIVLAWHMDSFSTDGDMIKEAFSISQKKLSTHVRALGGNVNLLSKNGFKRTSVILKLPLQFPNTAFKGRGQGH
uniref:DNA-directed RNA polymerase I subunit RPA49-like n=1 Tax=Ciona intestinalis TaxID=7719 RepID=UPI000180B172|nr:DNA-directed RNA polymerase I subunit RPA49-like [Ciona intestinalis]|eukprot:XP_002124450.1 DNA-directed RNA polymerase I subunit RPA49-like [Ciona intestinalis]